MGPGCMDQLGIKRMTLNLTALMLGWTYSSQQLDPLDVDFIQVLRFKTLLEPDLDQMSF